MVGMETLDWHKGKGIGITYTEEGREKFATGTLTNTDKDFIYIETEANLLAISRNVIKKIKVRDWNGSERGSH
jgi:hypothetical protein